MVGAALKVHSRHGQNPEAGWDAPFHQVGVGHGRLVCRGTGDDGAGSAMSRRTRRRP